MTMNMNNMIIASFCFISQDKQAKSIQIVCNRPVVEIDDSPKKCPKYKKVGKNTKAILIEMVESGSSIVSAAQKLGINYSTAKSIIQCKNKEDSPKSANHCSTDDSNERVQIKPLLLLENLQLNTTK